ncbi:MAG: aspartate carbamoyltransferase regulatory subunit [Bacteroidetes bacterium]|nr:aspartate carbamoyltransferase regulatory subunit [Bacteroidota bacterium]MBU1719875.1 aspartate carbamoyltransferase regulatory subunit [Bacteroidota bacterium]
MEKDKRKELIVSAIENGTVIDHIPVGNVLRVLRILGLESTLDPIYLGANLESKKYGQKGIIKVANKYFKPEEINKITLVASTATIIEIKDYNVISKQNAVVPDRISKFVKCFNPNCVTNVEGLESKFDIIDKEDIKLLCHYCEKTTKEADFVFI